MGYLVFLVARMAVVGFALLTWAYGVSTYSPFAFEMFVRPQLFPWIGDFVVWHHAWYWAAFATSVATLLPDVVGRRARMPGHEPARWLSAGYILVFGAIGARMIDTPYLPSLPSQARGFFVALAPLAPLAWLAVIDHLATHRVVFTADQAPRVTSQSSLLLASVGGAVNVWLGFAAHGWWQGAPNAGVAAWSVATAWSLVLVVGVFMIAYVLLSLVVSVAATRPHPRAWEHGLGVALMAMGLGEFFRRSVFPSLSFDPRAAAVISVAAGVTLSATWSGLRLRRAASGGVAQTGWRMLLSPRASSTGARVVILVGMPVATLAALDRIGQFDWFFLLQTLILTIEGLVLFGVWLGVPLRERPWSVARLLAPPLVALALLHAAPAGIAAVMSASGHNSLDPDVVLDRQSVADPAFRFAAAQLIGRPAPDPAYYNALLRSSARSLEPLRSVPRIDFATALEPPSGRGPNVFLFVIDGLRRDYLSPYNPAVRFTPNIEAWARGSLVFANAFTRYGGTLLAMPSLWVGGEVTRAWARGPFDRMNTLERLVRSGDHRFLINDHTVAGRLNPATRRVFLDPDVKSIDTDVCSLVEGLERDLSSTTDARPVFAFLAPMNVHVLNNPRSGTVDQPGHPFHGFYEPYASRVQRVDGCFGGFIAYLKQTRRYDNSVIVVTADHGESMGEGGRWGHQYWLFPEDIRIPLIMSVPASWRAEGTTDLGRVAFSTDIAPTLYRLLGHDVRDLGPLFGAPLVVPRQDVPRPRRRDAFVVMSSYGPSYGLLRRNGRFLYISDLINIREYAFELFQGPLGTPVRISDDARRVNQAAIREHVAVLDAFYHPEP